jgi:hypothetical protein
MYHDLPRGGEFWSFLFEIDQDLAETAHKDGCACGGRLDKANYPRKPRGGPDSLPKSYQLRLSFCCSRDGCRKRLTPPSVRFLGRKVYLSVIILIISAMRQGPTPRRVRALSERFGADRRTIARWQVLWREHVPQTPFWKAARARLEPVIKIVTLPYSLLDAFLHSDSPGTGQPMGDGDLGSAVDPSLRCRAPDSGWERLLRFLAPITIAGGLATAVSL